MKKSKWLLVAICAFSMSLFSCVEDTEEDTEGNWIRRSYFEGNNRANSSSFTIDGRHFVVGGYTGDQYMNDLWEYDSNGDLWIRKADFPGNARANAVAFALDGKAYYGTGYNGKDRLGDFWEYDLQTNTWSQIADFPGTARYNAIGFSLGNYGFVGTGFDGSEQKDFYKYDPRSDTWAAFSSFGGAKRQGPFHFQIGETVYMGGGINNGSYQNDFWALDAATLTWTQKTNLDEEDEYTMSRNEAMGFTIGGYGYVSVGSNGQLIESTWEYIPSLDAWDQKTSFEGSLRIGATVFNANDRAFVLLGRNSSLRYDDMWEFRPFEDYNEDD